MCGDGDAEFVLLNIDPPAPAPKLVEAAKKSSAMISLSPPGELTDPRLNIECMSPWGLSVVVLELALRLLRFESMTELIRSDGGKACEGADEDELLLKVNGSCVSTGEVNSGFAGKGDMSIGDCICWVNDCP